MKGYTEPEKLKRWWPTMPVMHACTHFTTLQVGLSWATTHFLEVSKAADMCITLRIHNQCKCCCIDSIAAPQWSLPMPPKFIIIQDAVTSSVSISSNATITSAVATTTAFSIIMATQIHIPPTSLDDTTSL